MMTIVLKELGSALNSAAFLAGGVSGIALTIAVLVIGSYITSHWNTALLFCAITAAAGLLLIGLR